MPKDLSEINEILQSVILAYGEYTKKFEKLLQIYFSTDQVFAVNSFNSAISVVLATIDAKFGDEVIASPMACLASTQPYASFGLKNIWADINPETGTLDPDSVKNKITKHTKVIVNNHFCGYPGYINEINAIGESLEYMLLMMALNALVVNIKTTSLVTVERSFLKIKIFIIKVYL